ncbi:hypothetical protein [Streptomyces atroolivaceus]|uniref:hypothetical protein n=1 Tax=Streptomyces atroolivaceus TaxID=66869 RepID=UPI00362FD9DA
MTPRATPRTSSRPRAAHSDTGSAYAAPSAYPAFRRAPLGHARTHERPGSRDESALAAAEPLARQQELRHLTHEAGITLRGARTPPP